MNVKANNWILPLTHEERILSDETFIRDLGMAARIKIESAPIFNNMQANFWLGHFMRYKHAELCQMVTDLGLPIRARSKSAVMTVLISYFKVLVEGTN